MGSYIREFATQFTQFNGSSGLNQISTYYQLPGSNKLDTRFVKNNALLYVNTVKPYMVKDETVFSPLYLQGQNQVYAPNSVTPNFSGFLFICNLGAISNLAFQKELYKVMILLCLAQTFK